MNDKTQIIGFIGGGNMARSIIGGLVCAGQAEGSGDGACTSSPVPVTPSPLSTTPSPAKKPISKTSNAASPPPPSPALLVAEPDDNRRTSLVADFGVHTGTNAEVAAHASLLVLAVKPNVMRTACDDIRTAVQVHKPLIISIAAGVMSDDVQQWLGGVVRGDSVARGDGVAIVRAMPNTPALVNCAATALFANSMCKATHRQRAERVMSTVGITSWVEEEHLLDAITALSGCGPAYFFAMLEVMSHNAINAGLTPATARAFALQTALGAARLAQHGASDFAELRRRVTSPGGATECALAILERDGFARTLDDAMNAACTRARELAIESRRAA